MIYIYIYNIYVSERKNEKNQTNILKNKRKKEYTWGG